jgi:glycine/D-amino acid oxidase-like deaminating enzyme
VERIVTEYQIGCDFRRGGKIKLATSAAHFEAMARGFELLHREADAETELLERARVPEEIGSSLFHGALVYRRSAQMHMGKFGRGLADAARRHGARIFENAKVTGWRRLRGSAYRLTTARGTVVAKQVFVATGAAVDGKWFFRRRIIPIGSFIIATAPLSEGQIASVMPTRRTATTTKNIGNYFRIAPDNRLIFGGRARFALSNPASDVKSGIVLRGQLREMFPQIADVPIEYCWGGEVDATADRLPRAGERDGLFYAMGLSGHGAQMSVHLGERMAAVMGGDAGANPFAGLDWPAVAGHFGPPWFLPLVGLYYRTKDRLG